MIQIKKPRQAPKILRDKGKKKRQANCKAYTLNKAAYRKGKKNFKFYSNIYGDKTVKKALIKAQNDKCCFCESKCTHISYGDVEHFRPKGGFKQSPNGPLGKPGYYWLAYEWSNLFFSCQLCNQRFKKNLFPLKNPGDRAISHNDDINAEKPMFISPAENPEQFISFREEVAYAVKDNPRGKATIEELGLNRVKLSDMRKKHFDILRTLYEVANHKPAIPASSYAKAHIDKCIQSSSQYASMARCALKDGFQI